MAGRRSRSVVKQVLRHCTPGAAPRRAPDRTARSCTARLAWASASPSAMA